MKSYKIDTENDGHDEIVFVSDDAELKDIYHHHAVNCGYDKVPDHWSVNEYPGYHVGVQRSDSGWDELGSWSTEKECIEEIVDSLKTNFEYFEVDDNDCVVMAISEGDEAWSQIFKGFRDGTIIQETANGVFAGQLA